MSHDVPPAASGPRARLGLLVGSPKIGGAERQVYRLAKGLRAAGHEVVVLFMERQGRRDAGSCIDFSEVQHRYLGHGRGRGWLARRRLRRHAGDLDAVLAFNLDAMELLSSSVPAGAGTMRVGSVRGLGFTTDAHTGERLRDACEAMDAVTCNSPAIARALVELGVGTVELLPNIIPSHPVTAREPREAFVALFVANLIPVKQPEMFISACARASAEIPGLRAVVVGDGPLRGELEVLASGLEAEVDFLGHLPPEDVPFDRADVLVSTSRREGASNAILEAMASGVAVVATRAGGNVDLLEQSGAGILVQVDDTEGVGAALVRMSRDPEFRATLGKAGAGFVRTRHAEDAVIGRLLELIAAHREGAAYG